MRCFNKCIKHYIRPFKSCINFSNFIIDFFPIISWLPKYQWKKDIINDIVGGLTVGIMHVPQGTLIDKLTKFY